MIEPSLDWERDYQIKMKLRVEDDVPCRESARINAGYMLASLKKAGLKARFIGMTPEGVSVDALLAIIDETNPSLIGMTAFTFQINTVGKMAKILKEKFPNIPICVGGCHVTALPQRTLEEFPEVDFVFMGEADTAIVDIVAKGPRQPGVVFRGGTSCSVVPEKLNDLPFPAWEDFDLSKFPGMNPHGTRLELPVMSGRGCPFDCVFCGKALGKKVRRPSVDYVLAEIDRNIKQFKAEAITFLDETFILNKRWITGSWPA